MTHNRCFNMRKTAGVTCEAGTAYTSVVCFWGVCGAQSVFCVVFRGSSFVLFVLTIFCHFSMYYFCIAFVRMDCLKIPKRQTLNFNLFLLRSSQTVDCFKSSWKTRSTGMKNRNKWLAVLLSSCTYNEIFTRVRVSNL